MSKAQAANVLSALHSLKKTAPALRWRLGDYGRGLSKEDRAAMADYHGTEGTFFTLPSGVVLSQEEAYSLKYRVRNHAIALAGRVGRTAGQRAHVAQMSRMGWL